MAASSAPPDAAPSGVAGAERRSQIAALTGLRGLAAMLVVLIHTAGMTAFGWLGIPEYGPVSLFVLSGYLLYRPWSRWGLGRAERPAIRSFYWKRLWRIFPAYLVVLLCVTAVFPPSRPTDATGWLHSLTLTRIYVPGGLTSGFLHTWSLGTELAWYLLLPVLGITVAGSARRLGGRTGFWVVVASIALAVPVTLAWRVWVEATGGGGFTRSFWVPAYLVCFGAGALVAHLGEAHRAGIVSLTRLRAAAADPWVIPLILLAVLLLGTSSLAGPDGIFPDMTISQRLVRFGTATLVASGLLVVAVFGGAASPVNRVLNSAGAQSIGRWSYGIYLWHVPIIWIVAAHVDIGRDVPGLIEWLALVLVTTIPLAAATYAWVERPIIAWSRGEPRPQRVAASTPDSERLPAASVDSARSATMAQASAPPSAAALSVLPAE